MFREKAWCGHPRAFPPGSSLLRGSTWVDGSVVKCRLLTITSTLMCTADPSLPPIGESAATLPRTREPPQWPVSKISREWDFARVRRTCLDLYGSELIGENDCPEDTTRLRNAYEVAGVPLPPGLRGDRR